MRKKDEKFSCFVCCNNCVHDRVCIFLGNTNFVKKARLMLDGDNVAMPIAAFKIKLANICQHYKKA